jgi:predicted enzyme related to lactoylglutathione lyase
MQRVTGLGGIFFKSADPQALGAWYQRHLGLAIEDWGGAVFRWRTDADPEAAGSTLWSPFAADTTYFAPSTEPYMINFRVADLEALLSALRAEGCQVDERVEVSEFGRFGWVMDPEGRRIELWQPPAGQ